MKKYVYILVLFFSFSAHAQKKGQLSQYLNNPYLISPAMTGIYDYLDIDLGYRKQWTGFSGSPESYYLTGHRTLNPRPKNHKKSSLRIATPYTFDNLFDEARRKTIHGLGASVSSQSFGPFRKNLIALSYAAHFPLTSQLNMSLGIGLENYKLLFDDGLVDLELDGDRTYDNFAATYNNNNIQDANFGLMIYSKKFHFAYTAAQLFQNNLVRLNGDMTPTNEIYHYAMTGVKIPVSKGLTLLPIGLVKYVPNSPITFDISLKAEIDKRFWIGASYRDQDAIIGLVGFVINDLVKVSYTYDYTISDVQNFSTGSHEIILGVKLK